jgi:hypothetical protein
VDSSPGLEGIEAAPAWTSRAPSSNTRPHLRRAPSRAAAAAAAAAALPERQGDHDRRPYHNFDRFDRFWIRKNQGWKGMRMVTALIITGLLAISGGAIAGGNEGQFSVSDSVGFEAQVKTLQRDLADGKTYSELDQKQRSDVSAALDRIRSALGSHGGVVDSMPQETKLQVFNDQELVNTVLTKGREDSRLMCTRETPIGSHRSVTYCKTVAERRRDREQSQDALRSAQRPVFLDPSK